MQDPNASKPIDTPSVEPNTQPTPEANQPQSAVNNSLPVQDGNNSSKTTTTPRTLITIFFLFVFPIIGLILMFLITKWPKGLKIVITLVFTIIAVIAILLVLQLNKMVDTGVGDAQLRSNVQVAGNYAYKYCLGEGRCPNSLKELAQSDYAVGEVVNTQLSYELLDNGKNCTISAALSSGDIYEKKCFPDQ